MAIQSILNGEYGRMFWGSIGNSHPITVCYEAILPEDKWYNHA